jgi:dTDP-4-amino-4,6-dideoxygalactose transaminase
MRVPFLDLNSQHARLRTELDAALRSVIDTGSFVGGPAVEQFEREFARFSGRRHARGVASGTAALAIALRALDLGPHDEVITTAHSAVPTAEAIVLAGATPVLVDIDPYTWLIDPDRVEAAITPRTRALLPVHLYGMPAPLDRLLEIAARHDLAVIEDCAQSAGARFHGRQVGSFGLAGCHSFFPSKNLGAFGDGGAIVTDDARIDRFAATYRDHGRLEKFMHERIGANERLDALQASVLSVKLQHLEAWNALRRRVADWYAEDLRDIDGLRVQRRVRDAEPVWHLFVIAARDRDSLAARLRDKGIGTGLHYPLSLNLQPAFAFLKQGPGSLPQAERTCREVLSLPMDPFLTREQVRYVADSVKQAVVRVNAA